jgi:molybdopterin molybdotransferase
MADLLSVAEAEGLIAGHVSAFGVEPVSFDAADGRILRQAVFAERDQPPFDRVMMDGIGVRWSDPLPPSFALAGAQMAGMARAALDRPDACLEVTTGAIVPAGCDCIIPVEQTRRDGDRYVLAEGYRPSQGQFIHAQGSDVRAGVQVLEAGVRLGPPQVALLAANGVGRVDVAVRPSVGVLATGDELVSVDTPLGEGQVRRSNEYAIAAVLRAHGIGPVALGHVADDLDATIQALDAMLAAHDAVIVSGGVSMGQRDFVAEALRALKVEWVFHRIAQRPGRPMGFGVGPAGQPVFALPGNPVSSLVCTVRYVRPALLAAMGLKAAAPEWVQLDAEVQTAPALTCFVPVAVRQDETGRSMAHPVISTTSGDFSTLAQAHGVVQLPIGEARVPAGTVAALYRW